MYLWYLDFNFGIVHYQERWRKPGLTYWSPGTCNSPPEETHDGGSKVRSYSRISSLISASAAFGSATNVYITQSGSASGNCTSNVQTPAFFNNANNWGSGATQIGPGTTVLICGTFTSSAKGGNVLTVQGSGSASGQITILFDTGAQMNSTGWWGSYNADACSTCTGAITVNGVNYVTIDGGSNGIIQNLLNGTPGKACASGTCTQQSGDNGSLGIHLAGDHLIVRNLIIQNIYSNAGSSESTLRILAGMLLRTSAWTARPRTFRSTTTR